MKIKVISCLMAGMIAVSAAMFVTPPMVSRAASQDEPKENLEYIDSLVDQGYSEEEIYKYVDTHADGALSGAMEDLPETIANGNLEKADDAKGAYDKKLRKMLFVEILIIILTPFLCFVWIDHSLIPPVFYLRKVENERDE